MMIGSSTQASMTSATSMAQAAAPPAAQDDHDADDGVQSAPKAALPQGVGQNVDISA